MVIYRFLVMSSSLPVVPNILYCGIRENTMKLIDQFLQSETIEAALTRLIGPTGTIHTVDYKEHIANRQCYVIKLECTWPRGKAKAILDPKEGSVKLRKDGYNVAIRTREKGGYSFVILSPHEVVYQVVYEPPSASSVVIGTRRTTTSDHYRRGLLGDPRKPQEELDALVFKLNRPYSPLDEFSVQKISTSHRRELVWAKESVTTILKRAIRGKDDCWRYVLVEGESARELQLQVLFLSFGRECPGSKSGLKVVHRLSGVLEKGEEPTVEVCVRPSHLHLISSLDPSTLEKTAEDLAILLGQIGIGSRKK